MGEVNHKNKGKASQPRLSFVQIFWRCLRSRCPVCGEGRLFARILEIERWREILIPLEDCNCCHFHFAREPGYYFGIVTPILPLLAVFSGALFAGIAHFFGRAEIDTVYWWGFIGLVFGFFAFFRTAVSVYISLDHAIAPPG